MDRLMASLLGIPEEDLHYIYKLGEMARDLQALPIDLSQFTEWPLDANVLIAELLKAINNRVNDDLEKIFAKNQKEYPEIEDFIKDAHDDLFNYEHEINSLDSKFNNLLDDFIDSNESDLFNAINNALLKDYLNFLHDKLKELME